MSALFAHRYYQDTLWDQHKAAAENNDHSINVVTCTQLCKYGEVYVKKDLKISKIQLTKCATVLTTQ